MREFKQVIAQFEKDTGNTIEVIKLCGGAAVFPDTTSIVSEALSVTTEVINPFDSVAYPAFMEDTMKLIGPSFAPALGAALRQFQ